jgi:beta-N-acetylhexosaminidase
MTAHIKVPSLDEIAPATLSKKTLGLLRERGFQGVILADSLVMEGVLASCDGDVAKASIEALNAGCDLLLLGGKQLLGDRGSLELLAKDVCRAHGEIVRAVKEGRIPQSRIEESLARVLQLKSKYKEQGKPWVSPVEATALAEKVSASAVSIYKKGSFHLTEKKRLVWIPQEVSLFMDTLSLQGAEILFYPATVSSEEELKALDQKALLAEEIVFCSYNAWKYPVQQKLLAKLQCMGKPLAVFALRDPADVELCPQADAILATFSPTCLSLQAAYQRLLK